MKVLILSDLHLGTDVSRAGNLLNDIRPLASQYDRVILNGDTLDRLETPDCEPDSGQLLAEVNSVFQSRSGPPELLTGNHDPAISKVDYVYLQDAATLVFHGDCIADCTHPAKLCEQALARYMKAEWERINGRPKKFLDLVYKYRRAQHRFLEKNPSVREAKSTIRYIMGSISSPFRAIDILKYWARSPGQIAEISSTFDQPIKRVVTGHTHRAGHWKISGLDLYNTGSCMPLSAPYAIIADGHHISLRPLLPMLRTNRVVLPALTAAGR